MAKAYPIELRDRVVNAYSRGEGSFPELARRFDIGEATVSRWVQLKRQTGSLAPRPRGVNPRPCKIDETGLEFLRETLVELPDSTLQELVRAYEETFGVRVHLSTMHKTVRTRLGMTRKRGARNLRNAIGKT